VTIAFDPGTFAFRSLRRRGHQLVARRCRTIAVTVADNQARRRWLKRSNLPHLVTDEFLVLPGDAAVEAENLLGAVPRDLLPDGELPKSDPVTRQVIAQLVDGILPPAAHPEEVCCFAQPACEERMLYDDPTFDERLQFFSRIIRLRGYLPLPLNPATALVLAELGPAGFTGVGLALGASGCDVAIVHQGRQIACGRLSRGGRWIDEQMIGELVKVLRETLDSQPRIALLPQPLPLVCGGGLTRITGFAEALERELSRQQFPIALAGLRLAADAEYSVARGCLIQATLEESAAASHDERRTPPARELANA